MNPISPPRTPSGPGVNHESPDRSEPSHHGTGTPPAGFLPNRQPSPPAAGAAAASQTGPANPSRDGAPESPPGPPNPEGPRFRQFTPIVLNFEIQVTEYGISRVAVNFLPDQRGSR
ncbi:unnamed protein product [Calypogeia fissa]